MARYLRRLRVTLLRSGKPNEVSRSSKFANVVMLSDRRPSVSVEADSHDSRAKHSHH